jgi:hypothetical protein
LGAEHLNGSARHGGTGKIDNRTSDRDEFLCPEIARCHCSQRKSQECYGSEMIDEVMSDSSRHQAFLSDLQKSCSTASQPHSAKTFHLHASKPSIRRS